MDRGTWYVGAAEDVRAELADSSSLDSIVN